MPPLYVEVLLPLPFRKCRYTYLAQEGMDEKDLLHRLALVTFGQGKIYTGLIVSVGATPREKISGYKTIIGVLPYHPLPDPTVQLIVWAADYYMCSEGDVLRSVVPASYRPDGDARYTMAEMGKVSDSIAILAGLPRKFTLKDIRKLLGASAMETFAHLLSEGIVVRADETEDFSKPNTIRGWIVSRLLDDEERVSEIQEHFRRSAAVSRVLAEIISTHKKGQVSKDEEIPVPLTTLADIYGVSLPVIRKLRDCGIFVEHEVCRSSTTSAPPLLSSEDDTLSRLITQELSTSSQRIILAHLEGTRLNERIPFSYIGNTIDQGGQVLLLFPTLDALHSTLVSFTKGAVKEYHSGTSVSNRNKVWFQAMAGERGLFVGLRSAVWLPLSRLETIVIMDEESNGYRQYEPAPRFNALQVALMLSIFNRCVAVMSTATPSVERYLLAQDGKYRYIHTTPHTPRKVNPEMVSLKEGFKKNKVRGRLLSFELMDAIRQTQLSGGKSLLLFHRKGYARQVVCTECATPLVCPSCNISYRYFEGRNLLVCPLCGKNRQTPDVCPSCTNKSLTMEGTGIERLHEEVQRIYPDARVLMYDAAAEPSVMSGDIILSSDMELPHTLLDQVSMIAFVQIDLLTTMPDFRANEVAYRLLCKCLNEASHLKTMIIQYLVPGQNVLEAVEKGSYTHLFEYEMNDRLLIGYPPFSRMIDIYIESEGKRSAFALAGQIASKLKAVGVDPVMGPAPLPVHKKMVDSGYKLTCMLPLDTPAEMKVLIRDVTEAEMKDFYDKRCRVYFDVDPL